VDFKLVEIIKTTKSGNSASGHHACYRLFLGGVTATEKQAVKSTQNRHYHVN